jgi:tetratricopeptide (TPR) repeat protein
VATARARGARWSGILALLGLAVLAKPARADEQGRFAQALRLERSGDAEGAVRILDGVGSGEGPLADDALMQAGRILEEKLGRPAQALARYSELGERFPRSRLARRAASRVSFLSSNLSTGEGPLAEFQRIVSGTSGQDLGHTIARMQRLLAQHPGFPSADRGLLWLGGAYRRAGRTGKALDTFSEVTRRFPRSRSAARAQEEIGNTYLSLGRLGEAEAAFRTLEARGDARTAARGGLLRAAAVRQRRATERAAWIGSVAAVGGLLFLAARKAGRQVLRPGVEVAFTAPLFGVLLLLALAERWRATGGSAQAAPSAWQFAAATEAIAIMAAGGLVLAHLGGVLARTLRPSRGVRLLLAPGLALAALAVCVLALDATGLASFVLETLRRGAE